MKKQIMSLGILVLSLLGASSAFAAGYASIAYSPSTGQWGEFHGASTAYDAQKIAVMYCKESDCASVGWVSNGYMAVAVNEEHRTNMGLSQDLNQAEQIALAQCQGQCTILTWTSAF